MNALLKPEWGDTGVSNDWCIRFRILRLRETLCDGYIMCEESHYVRNDPVTVVCQVA